MPAGNIQPVLEIDDAWYDALNLPSASGENLCLKRNDTFLSTTLHATIGRAGLGEHGLYHRGTRFLSRWEFLIADRYPMLIRSEMPPDNHCLMTEFTTPKITIGSQIVCGMGQLHATRIHTVDDGMLFETLILTSFAQRPVEVSLRYEFAGDFRDIFEVRGIKRDRHGEPRKAEIAENVITLSCRGLDGVLRSTRIQFDRDVRSLSEGGCEILVSVDRMQETILNVVISCLDEQCPARELRPSQAAAKTRQFLADCRRECALIESSDPAFNGWIERSLGDLCTLTTIQPGELMLYAGIPWFSSPFGRDSLIPSLQTVWINPIWARGTLAYLAENQATSVDHRIDAEPGKILHEVREGEMATLDEIPFEKYYGTIDATPLFLILAGRYFHRTRDRDFIRSIWTNLLNALQWIDAYGDRDGDGFVEYSQRQDVGLTQQGWKDSGDSLSHQDGSAPQGAIALAEVQGYVYAARTEIAAVAHALGEMDLAEQLLHAAARLKTQFNKAFWVDDLGTFAIALDGEKRPCRVLNSNAGQTLMSGIADRALAPRLVKSLMSAASYSGWGIRTLGTGEARYNPMSYHNGSVWPHDNSLIAAGLSRYGYHDEALRIFDGLFAAAKALPYSRIPELFCGFERGEKQTPALYPAACAPQAWAAGAVLLMLEHCLGITFPIDGPPVRIQHPRLPTGIDILRVKQLHLGDGQLVDLLFRRSSGDRITATASSHSLVSIIK